MKINTPSIPIRLPTNSTVSFRLGCREAKKKASIMPTIIIGIPIPTEMRFEVIVLRSNKIYMNFM